MFNPLRHWSTPVFTRIGDIFIEKTFNPE